jgi:hypothetical protein
MSLLEGYKLDADCSYQPNLAATRSYWPLSEVEIPILLANACCFTVITTFNLLPRKTGNLIHGNYQEGMDTSTLVESVITKDLYLLLLVLLLLFDSDENWMWIW